MGARKRAPRACTLNVFALDFRRGNKIGRAAARLMRGVGVQRTPAETHGAEGGIAGGQADPNPAAKVFQADPRKTKKKRTWISLDFLGFSSANRDFSMGCADPSSIYSLILRVRTGGACELGLAGRIASISDLEKKMLAPASVAAAQIQVLALALVARSRYRRK